MARKTETFTVSGQKYTITQLGATEGSELWDDIVGAVGPKLTAKLSEGIPDIKGMTNEQLAITFGPLLLDVVSTVPKSLKQRWRLLFTRTTTVDAGVTPLNMAKAELFDEHFAGRYGAMTAWELTCLKFNFFDFLGPKDSSPNSEAAAR